MKKKYTILTDEKTVNLMCIKPYANCALFNTFRGLLNVQTTKTVTPDGVLVYTFAPKGDETGTKEGVSMVRDLAGQICSMCQAKYGKTR